MEQLRPGQRFSASVTSAEIEVNENGDEHTVYIVHVTDFGPAVAKVYGGPVGPRGTPLTTTDGAEEAKAGADGGGGDAAAAAGAGATPKSHVSARPRSYVLRRRYHELYDSIWSKLPFGISRKMNSDFPSRQFTKLSDEETERRRSELDLFLIELCHRAPEFDRKKGATTPTVVRKSSRAGSATEGDATDDALSAAADAAVEAHTLARKASMTGGPVVVGKVHNLLESFLLSEPREELPLDAAVVWSPSPTKAPPTVVVPAMSGGGVGDAAAATEAGADLGRGSSGDGRSATGGGAGAGGFEGGRPSASVSPPLSTPVLVDPADAGFGDSAAASPTAASSSPPPIAVSAAAQADEDAKGVEGEFYTVGSSDPDGSGAQVYEAAGAGNDHALTRLLTKRSPPAPHSGFVDEQNGWMAIHAAASQGHLACLSVLLEAGADPRARTENHHSTPLHWAAYYGRTECCQRLLEAGADPNAANNMGLTPAHMAATTGHVDALRVLAEEGEADLDRPDKRGETPAALAKTWGRGAVLAFLADVRERRRSGWTIATVGSSGGSTGATPPRDAEGSSDAGGHGPSPHSDSLRPTPPMDKAKTAGVREGPDPMRTPSPGRRGASPGGAASRSDNKSERASGVSTGMVVAGAAAVAAVAVAFFAASRR